MKRIDRTIQPVLRREGVIAFLRFRDDCLILKKRRGNESRVAVTQAIEGADPAYTIDVTWSGAEAVFLDLKLRLGPSGLEHETHHKPTNLFNYLLWASDHARIVFRSWTTSEALRLAVTCSNQNVFERKRAEFVVRLRRCGYPREIQILVQQLQYGQRNAVLNPTGARDETPKVALVLPNHSSLRIMDLRPAIRFLRQSLQKIFGEVHADPLNLISTFRMRSVPLQIRLRRLSA